MDQYWYYEDHGRAKGPVTTDELVQKIKTGAIKWVDLVFKDGDKQWQPVQSFTELTDLIGNVTLQDTADWIVLKCNDVDGKSLNQQMGPYNAQQILDLLDKGKIRFSDFVWRDGYEKWVPLGRVDEFEQPLRSSVAVDKSLYTKPRLDDSFLHSEVPLKVAPLKKVTPVVIKNINQQTGEDMPADAKGRDLTAPVWLNPPEEHVTEVPHASQTPFHDEKTPPPITMASNKARRDLESSLDKQNLEVAQTSQFFANVEKISAAEDEAYLAEQGSASWLQKLMTAFKGTKAAHAKPDSDALTGTEVTATNIQIEAPVVETQAARSSNRTMYIGAGACVLVIIFILSAMMSLGKKKLDTLPRDEFSIKVGEPSSEVQQKNQLAQQQAVDSQGGAPQSTVAVAEKKTVPTKTTKTEPESKSQAGARREAGGKNPTIGGSFKNKSYFHHKERIYLFYSSNEGQQLASDLQKASKKHQKSSKQWKNFYGGWKGRAKNYSSKVGKEARKARLHRKLFHQLATSASDLEDIGRDMDAQISKGRGPSRVASAKNIETQFKSIHNNARALDR